eukprot:scpid84732/ scgid28508/ 
MFRFVDEISQARSLKNDTKMHTVDGAQLVLLVGDGAVVSVHIFGVADETPLSAITSAMEKFGTTVGLSKREEKSVDGCTFTTGTVFVNVVPKSTVPSTIVLPGSGQKICV